MGSSLLSLVGPERLFLSSSIPLLHCQTLRGGLALPWRCLEVELQFRLEYHHLNTVLMELTIIIFGSHKLDQALTYKLHHQQNSQTQRR